MSNTVFEPIAVRMMSDLIADFGARGMRDFHAAAIAGNGGEESEGFTDVTENDPSSGVGGLGFFQWTGRSAANNRRLLFEQWLARPANVAKGYSPTDYGANYSFLYRELTGTEKGALAALLQTATLEEATQVFMERFERPGVPALAKRISYARRALAAFVAAGSPMREQPVNTGVVLHTPAQEVLAPTGLDLERLMQILAALSAKPAAAPAPPPPPPTPASSTPASVKASALAFAVGALLQILGVAPPPEVIGPIVGAVTPPTTVGTLTTFLPILTGIVGKFSGFSPLVGLGSAILDMIVKKRAAP